MNSKASQDLVKHVLNYPQSVEWSIQGLGMLRCYLGPDHITRLNIWDNRYRVADVSSIHDHPWSFESYVIAGRIVNTRFRRHVTGVDYNTVCITCGPGTTKANMETAVTKDRLTIDDIQGYGPGQSYTQAYYEIHETHYEDGTITINTRTVARENNSANVYWATGSWVSAEPRPATRKEVEDIVSLALLGIK